MASIPRRERDAARVAERFCGHNNLVSVTAVLVDLTLYAGAVGVAVLSEGILVKLTAAIVAGTAISMLFILGHDAAHKSLVSQPWLNAALCRLLFLPCLHNYTLWVIQHNRLHHQFTNVRGLNSYSPLSVDDFRALPLWKRFRERTYRSIFGFGMYYLVERWWRDKFFPRQHIGSVRRTKAWLDFALLSAWVVVFLTVLARGSEHPFSAMLWGFLAPYLVWNQLMGLTAFLQHTHPKVPWFATKEEGKKAWQQAEVTIVVQFPRWYDVLSHNIMQHQAHHISPRIPWFRLRQAQLALSPMLGPRAVVEQMGLRYVLRLTRRCQLYDYTSHRWLRFDGNESAPTHAEFLERAVAEAH